MKLSVIIPQYKEEDKVVKRLLTSIDYQLNVDWNEVEVIIVNDGSDTLLSDEMLNSFENIKPQYIKLEKNVGPGLCRQAGLDASKGDYVAFCDADDLYHNCGVFGVFFQLMIEKPDIDILSTSWLEELKVEGQLKYINHGFNATWLHGKLYKKSFFNKYGLKFSDKLWYHEDSYIQSNMFALTKKVEHVDIATYVWTWGDDTITRRNNGEYSFSSYAEYVRAIGYSIDWLKERGIENMPQKVINLLIYVHQTLQSTKWEEKWVKMIENETAEIMFRNEEEIKKCPMEDVYKMEKERTMSSNVPYLETETLNQFLNRIRNAYIAKLNTNKGEEVQAIGETKKSKTKKK